MDCPDFAFPDWTGVASRRTHLPACKHIIPERDVHASLFTAESSFLSCRTAPVLPASTQGIPPQGFMTPRFCVKSQNNLHASYNRFDRTRR